MTRSLVRIQVRPPFFVQKCMVNDRGAAAPDDFEQFVAQTVGTEQLKPPEPFHLVDRLNTDALEFKYGKIHAHVLRHDSEMREAHLKDGQGVSRTYALTLFPKSPENPEIKQVDQEIQAGGLIGKVFRKHGYSIRKNVIGVRIVKLPGYLRRAFAVKTNLAKARLSEFYARKENGLPVIYGKIVEIYTPDFQPAVVDEQDIAQINPTTEAFEATGVSRVEIWDRLGGGNKWDDIGDKYVEAREISLAQANELNEQIDEYLESHS